MPRELRKRKEVPELIPPPPPKKTGAVGRKARQGKDTSATDTKPRHTSQGITVGQVIDLNGFGGEIETNDGQKTNLKELVDKSGGGVVLFTYPKASTPGCTTQVCLFRDSYAALSTTGFSIYGLSKDSTKANTNFKMKQNLPYSLLCDVGGTLVSAIGLKKAPSGTQRGVFVIDKAGKVLAAEPGSPVGTVNVVKKLVAESSPPKAGAVQTAERVVAETAAEFADTAEEIDGGKASTA